MNNFFSPRTIALIGASKDKTKIGHVLWQKLKRYSGKLYLVNPRFGYSRVSEIPAKIDLAVIAVPAAAVPEIIRDCGQKKVAAAIVISSGFAEMGPAGVRLTAPAWPVLGPNCFGVAHPRKNLDTTFAKTSPPAGNIGLISQSGALAGYLFNWAKSAGLGFSKFISLGNRLNLTENSFLEYLARDPDTKIIALYLESFADGMNWLKLASRVSRKKPIVVLCGGQTPAGKAASQSHTASVSPTASLVAAALRQSGCLQAKTITDFTNLLEVFSLEPELKDNDLAIITNAGGPAILAVDTASSLNLDSAKPIDVLGDADAQRFNRAFGEVLKDKTKDAYLIIITQQANTQIEATCRAIVRRFKATGKPIIVSLLTGQLTEPARKYLQQNQVAAIDLPQEAVTGLAAMLAWHRRHRLQVYPPRRAYARKLSSASFPSGRLDWQTASRLAKLYNLPLIKTEIASGSSKPPTLGWPVVLKADPSLATHRTENKAVYLNLKTGSAFHSALTKLKRQYPLVLVQEQVAVGHELFIGLRRESGWPPLLTLGGGGVYTELYQDLVRIFLPVNEKIIVKVLQQTHIGQIIFGFRGGSRLAIKPVVQLIGNACRLFEELPRLKELEINPALISESSVTIVDLKITAF